MVKVMPNPIRNRDLLMRNVYKKFDDASYTFVITPEDHPDYPANTGDLVRAHCPTTIKLHQLRESETKVDYLIQLDIGGSDEAGIVTYFMNLYLHKNLRRMVEMQQYFQQLRPLGLLDENDGVAMAEAFTLEFSKLEKNEAKKSKRSRAFTRVTHVISSHKALKQYSEENIWFS